jgi:Mg2+ and Co2+ transporter CorA
VVLDKERKMLEYLYKFSEKEYGTGEALTYPEPKEGFLWLHIVSPSPEEIQKIGTDFNIPKQTFEKYTKEEHSVRYSLKPLTFVFVDYYIKECEILVERTLFIVGQNYMISVTPTPLEDYDYIFDSIIERLPAYLLCEVLEYDIESNFDVLHTSEQRISELQKAVLEPEDAGQKIAEIVDFQHFLLQMSRRFWGSSKVLFSIKNDLTPIQVDETLLRLFDDVHDTCIYQIQIVGTQREVLTGALTIYETVLANRLAAISNTLNISIKKLTYIMMLLTGIATVLTVPNTIATVFGIPYFEGLAGNSSLILGILGLSLLLPIIWFYKYWKKVRVEAE